MSGTGSLMIRNLRTPSDYQKAVMNQDELLKIAIANDANISNARRAYRQGEVVPLSSRQNMTPDEIQADIGKNESDGITNLLDLGFRYKDASTIITSLNPDEIVILNNAYPSIKADFGKKFVVSRMTPTSFVEYLRKYIELFNISKGVTDNGAMFNDKFDAIINNIQDLRAIIPPPELIIEIANRVARIPNYSQVRDMFEDLAAALPDENFYRAVASMSDTDRTAILLQIQNLLQNLPTRTEFATALKIISSSAISDADKVAALDGIAGSINPDNVIALEGVVSSIRGRPSETRISQNTLPTPELEPIGVFSILKLGEKVYTLNNQGERGNEIKKEELNAYARTYRQFEEFLERIGVERSRNGVYQLGSFKSRLDALIKRNLPTASPVGAAGGARPTAGSTSTGNILPNDSVAGISHNDPAIAPTQGKGINTRLIHKKKIGKGLNPIEEPTYRQFGKFVIHQPQLLHQDILNVKYPSLGRIPQFKPTAISEATKDFILELLDEGKANPRVYDTLPVDERKLFEKIATGAGIFHHLKLKKTLTDDEAKDYERFQVLRGEYCAGNNSQALMKELRRLIVKFMSDGKIHKSEGTQLLMELSI